MADLPIGVNETLLNRLGWAGIFTVKYPYSPTTHPELVFISRKNMPKTCLNCLQMEVQDEMCIRVTKSQCGNYVILLSLEKCFVKSIFRMKYHIVIIYLKCLSKDCESQIPQFSHCVNFQMQ